MTTKLTTTKKRIITLFVCLIIAASLFIAYKKIRYADASKPLVIAVQPMAFADKHLLQVLKQNIAAYYHSNVLLLSNIDLPKEAYYAPRNRYKATKLIWFLKRQKPAEANYIIGVTTKDISTNKGNIPDWGIMGLGFCPGKSCVISTFRIKTSNQTLQEERLVKIALHEIGHNFGLGHCNTKQCFMHAAEGSIKQVDAENVDMCANCKQKIGL